MFLKSVGRWMDQGEKGGGDGRGQRGQVRTKQDRTGRDETNDSRVQAQMDWFLAVFAETRGRV